MSSNEIILITGANTGIGFETVKALFQSPKSYHILLGSRTTSKGEDAIAQLKQEFPESKSTVETVQIDIESDESIGKLYEFVEGKFGRVDVLINNAGAQFDGQFDKDLANSRALFNKTYDVNVSGTQAMTATFTPLLLKSASPRLIFLTSGLSTLAGSSTSLLPKIGLAITPGWPKEGLQIIVAYRAAKAALNMVMLAWHGVLKGDGVKVWCVSPGFLATGLLGADKADLLKKAGAGEPRVGGELLRKVVEGERDGDVGKVVTQNGEVQDW